MVEMGIRDTWSVEKQLRKKKNHLVTEADYDQRKMSISMKAKGPKLD